jgi:outer membrane protein assembly factor BamD
MIRWPVRLLLVGICVMALPQPSPAPLIFRPGEGWTYEAVGSEGKWRRANAKEQLQVAQAAFDKRDYGTALKAARYTLKQWPLAYDYAPEAQYLLGRCYEARHNDEKAFKEYQKLLEKFPKYDKSTEVLRRQSEIAGRFLGGQWFKLWGVIPFFSSMDKTAQMYQKIVNSGPYGDAGVQAQMKIGEARVKQKNYVQAAKAYEVAVDRYSDRPAVAADAFFKAGLAYDKQALKAEYDQSTAGKAIATLNDFITLFPDERRVPEAQKIIGALKTEQARGSYEIARYYEKQKRWPSAKVYYSEVVNLDSASSYATEARKRIDEINKRTPAAAK